MISIIRANRATTFNRAVSTVIVSMMVGIHPVGIVSVLANPTGEQLVAGQATFQREGSTLTITQTSQRAIINWQDFSISAGHLTQFIQNNPDAAALNRVVTLTPSLIAGTLQANGRIILINPNGITVGPGGVIDTGSFIGTTLDVSNDQFLAGGSLDFVGTSGAAITNLGSITGSDGVFLFARQIDNAGAIDAPRGQAGLASGSHILLQPASGDNRVSILVGTSADTALDGAAIRNSGEINSALATLQATGNAFSTAVNNEGIVRAQGFDTSGGRVLLTGGSTGTVLSSGVIGAANADGTGGRVEITGDRVALTGDALVDVSGANGGGTVLLGGSFQGRADSSVQNASRTFVGRDARILADATANGDGGTVIVWADGDTTFLGNISARGGQSGGNGGFAEVSGKEHLVYRGFTDLRAPVGSLGTLLLDPKNIIIDGVGGDALAGNTAFANNAGADVTFLNTDIVAALDGANLVLQANTDITVASGGAIDATGNAGVGSLTFEAGRSIAINDDILLRGAFTALANADAAIAAERDAGAASITLGAGATINTSATNGAITLGFGDGAGGPHDVDGVTLLGSLNSGAGAVNVSTAGASQGARDVTLGAINSGALTVTAGGIVTVDGAIAAANSAVALTGSEIDVNASVTAGTAALTLRADAMDIGAGLTGSTVTLRADSAGTQIDLGGADAAGVLGLTDAELDFVTASTALVVGSAGNTGGIVVSNAVSPAAAPSFQLTTGGSIDLQQAVNVGAGNLRLQSGTGTGQAAAGNITAAGLSTTGAGTVTLTAAANAINTFASSSTADVSLATTGGLSVGTVGTISGVSLSGNDLTLTTGGALTQITNIQVGDLTVTTTAGGITLNAANNVITGELLVSTPAAQAVSITNNNATTLGAITLTGGSFTLVSTGAITQSGALSLGTTATTFRTINNTGAGITLADTLNNFGALTAETRNLANDANVNAAISLADSSGFLLEDIRTLGNVTLVSGGLVTQTATSELIIGGNLAIDTTAYAAAGDVAFRSDAATGTTFAGDTIVQGDLTVTNSVGGTSITQTGGSSVSVAGTFNANPGVGGAVTLNESGNIINTLVSSDGSVIIRNVGDIDLDGTLIAGPVTGNLSVTALDQGDVFAGAAVTGTNAIALNVGGANNQIGTVTFVTENSGFSNVNAGTNNITQSVDLVVAGTANFIAGGTTSGDITLDRAGNNFTGAVSASGDNIVLVDSNAIVLGQTTAAGTYSVTAGGAVTQQVGTVLDVTGASSFANSGANAITLNQANLLDGAVSISQLGTGAVTLNNNQATVLGAITTQGGNLSVTSNGNLTQTGAITQTVGGALNLDVTGDATLDAANQLLAVNNVSSTGDVLIAEANGFNLTGTVNVAGALALDTVAGGVNQTGGSLAADELLLLGAGAYSLTQAANNVGTLAADVTGSITLVDSNGLVIGSVDGTDGVSTDGGNLSVTVAAGNLTLGQTVNPGAGGVTLQATTGQIVQSGSNRIVMGGGALSLNAAAGGAVGTLANPVLTGGSYSLTSAPTLAGGVFVSNGGTAGDVTVTSLAPANGAIVLANTNGSVTVGGAVASGVLGNVSLSASDDLLVNAAVNGTTLTLASGDQLALGANVGSGSTTTVVLDNTGALSRTAGTVTAGVSVTLQGAGSVGSGTLADTLTTGAPLVIFNKSAGDVFLRDTVGNLGLQGTLDGTLVVRAANDLLVPVGQTLTNNSATGLTALSAGGSINALANSGNLALGGGGLWLRAGTSIGTSPVDLMDFSGAGIVTARAAGPLFLNNTAGDLAVGALDASAYSGVDASFVNQSGLTTTVGGQGIRLNSAAGTTITVSNAVQTASGDIAIVVASPGGVPNGLIVDAVVQSNFVGGGNYVIGGGTVINVNPIAGVGTTITLDGGGQDINIATDQSYAGSVTFNAPGDILISAALAATGPSANITLTADSNLDGAGGVRIYDDVLTGSVSATGLVTITGSDLAQSAGVDFDAIVLDAGADRVTSSGAVQAIILQTTGSATDARNILIGGNVVSSNTGTTLIQSLGSADSFIDLTGTVSASQIAATNTITINTPGELRLDGTISTASTNNNAITIANQGAIVIDGGLLTASNSGGLSLAGAGNVGTGIGGDVLLTENIGRFTFNKAATNAFIVQQQGDAAIQGVIGGLVLVTEAGGITNSAALTAGRVTLDAAGTINLASSNNIASFVNAPGATGMGANVAANAVSTFGDFNYVSAGGSHLTLGAVAVSAPFGTGGVISVAGDTNFNLLAGTTNFTQLANSEIYGSTIAIRTSGTAAFASDVGDFGTTTILLNNAGAATFDAVTRPVFTATGTLTLQGNGAVGTLADTLLTDVSRLTLNKVSATPGVGDVFIEQIASSGGLQLDGTSGASVTVGMLGLGQDITQVAALNIGPGGAGGAASAGPSVANNTSATLSLSTAGGSVLLTNSGNKVRNFGEIDVTDGAFTYTGATGAAGVETRFTGDVNVSGIGAGMTVTFGGNVADRQDLVIANGVQINVAGNVRFIRNTVGATGSVYLGGDITTTEDGNILFQTGTLGDANFTPVVLTNNVVLATNSATPGFGNVAFDGPVSNLTGAAPRYDLTIHAGEGDVNFQRIVGGAAGALRIGDLLVNSQGNTTFTNQVFAESVTTDAGGITFLVFGNAGGFAVDTTGDQTYGDSVRLSADIDLRADGDVTFDGTVDSSTPAGARNLFVQAAGDTAFNDDVGVTNFLQTITTDAPGTVTINGNDLADGITIRTRGNQTYNATGGMVIGGGTSSPNVLTTYIGAGDAVAGNIVLNGGLNGLNAGVNDLVLITGTETSAAATGDITFSGAAGVGVQLGDILIPVVNNLNIAAGAGDSIRSTTFIQAFGFGNTLVNGGIRTSSGDTPDFINTFVAPANQGNVVQDDTLAGGVQIATNQIRVERNITAENGGIIRLTGLNAASDVIISGGTVQTTGSVDGSVRPAIGITAGDDVIIGLAAAGPARSSIVQTTDGAIAITARNQTADDVLGIRVQGRGAGIGSNAATVSAQGANGALTLTATQNQGQVLVQGGSGGALVVGSAASVNSSGLMTVETDRLTVRGGSSTGSSASLASAGGQDITVFNTASAPVALLVQGGSGSGASAAITNTGASQSITVVTGDLEVRGGSAALGATAAITASGSAVDQTIEVEDGDLLVQGGTGALGATAGIQRTAATSGTQQIDVAGSATVRGGTGVGSLAFIESSDVQLITVEDDLLVQGGLGIAVSTARITRPPATAARPSWSRAATSPSKAAPPSAPPPASPPPASMPAPTRRPSASRCAPASSRSPPTAPSAPPTAPASPPKTPATPPSSSMSPATSPFSPAPLPVPPRASSPRAPTSPRSSTPTRTSSSPAAPAKAPTPSFPPPVPPAASSSRSPTTCSSPPASARPPPRPFSPPVSSSRSRSAPPSRSRVATPPTPTVWPASS
jgi:filamentous hemagglutinin family protein